MEVETKHEIIARNPRIGSKTQTPSKQAEKQSATGAKKAPTKRKKTEKVNYNFFWSNLNFKLEHNRAMH